MIPDALPTPARRRNPGRRGIAADCYAWVPRFPLEVALARDPDYRKLRYHHDTAESRLRYLEAIGAPQWRIRAVRSRLLHATAACSEYLLRNLPQSEPQVPVVLSRTMGPDGELVEETETPVGTTGSSQ